MSKEVDILIIGGGAAGLSAGAEAARLGRSTLILTGDVVGGQLLSIEKIDGLAEFPDGAPGYDFCPMLQEQAEEAGAEFMMTSATELARADGRWRAATGEGEVLARGVVLATGTALKKLGVPGEERRHVLAHRRAGAAVGPVRHVGVEFADVDLARVEHEGQRLELCDLVLSHVGAPPGGG